MSPAASTADVDRLIEGVRQGDRRSLARAITLVESSRDGDQPAADRLLEELTPLAGESVRVGISGAPGSGKSTLIETLGLHVIDAGRRPAVLAVDPSSVVSGGSVLGDKSRMEKLAQADEAFIRPSPSAATLGGVARRTREVMLLAEAAGYDVVLVETVGVGQSEVEVAGMVDVFLVLLLPGSGDDLQGIKKGILEHADAWLVNKADGESESAAEATLSDYRAAMGYSERGDAEAPMAMALSALTGRGVDELWQWILERHAADQESGALAASRRAQRRRWMDNLAAELLLEAVDRAAGARQLRARLHEEVDGGSTSPRAAARALVDSFLN